jgi:hypothetical protein
MNIFLERQVPTQFYHHNRWHTYKINLTKAPLNVQSLYHFVWHANLLEREIGEVIDNWKEPKDNEDLELVVCLKNNVGENYRLMLTPYIITVVVAGQLKSSF